MNLITYEDINEPTDRAASEPSVKLHDKFRYSGNTHSDKEYFTHFLNWYYQRFSGETDVFLSYSSYDSDLLLTVKAFLGKFGFSVSTDLDGDVPTIRDDIDTATADALKAKMKKCDLLIYLHTQNSIHSKWCPWELGFFDGYRNSQLRTYILPVVKDKHNTDMTVLFKEQEYLKIYPIIDFGILTEDVNSKRELYGRYLDHDSTWPISTILKR